MSDTAYPVLQHYGTNAQRLAFTPSPAAGTQPIYIWYETDTDKVFAYTTAWHQISAASSGSAISALTGDVTATGPGSVAATIANDAVTLAKLANASANDKVLGSGNAGAGANYAEITLGSGLTMTGTTLSAAGSGGTVTHTGALTSGKTIVGNGTDDVTISSLTATVVGSSSGTLAAATAGTDYTALAFKTISVSGQSDVVADGPADTLTLAAGTNITITTNAGTDTVTITASGGGGGTPGGSSKDIQYNNAGAFGGITPGASGTVLTSGGAGVTPSFVAPSAASGLVLLGTYTASGAASRDITTRTAAGTSGAIFQSDYDAYKILMLAVTPATNGTDLKCRVSTTGGSSWDSSAFYDYTGNYSYQPSNAGGLGLNTQSSWELCQSLTNTTTTPGCIEFLLLNPLSTAVNTQFISVDTGVRSSVSTVVHVTRSGQWRSTTAVDAIQFFMLSGNLSGTWIVYGLAK